MNIYLQISVPIQPKTGQFLDKKNNSNRQINRGKTKAPSLGILGGGLGGHFRTVLAWFSKISENVKKRK